LNQNNWPIRPCTKKNIKPRFLKKINNNKNSQYTRFLDQKRQLIFGILVGPKPFFIIHTDGTLILNNFNVIPLLMDARQLFLTSLLFSGIDVIL
jgi:hypothetical protein